MTGDFKYMNWIEHNYEEVFDVKHDPHETYNLAGDSKYKTKLAELRKRYQVLKKTHGVPEDVWNKAKTKF